MFGVLFNVVATKFGAYTLFLAPEYLGELSKTSFGIVGFTVGIFLMSWHITTFIVHSKRIPFLGGIRNAFLIYCLNNSLLPLIYLVTYCWLTFNHLTVDEYMTAWQALTCLLVFVFGLSLAVFISFLYFFNVDKSVIKEILGLSTGHAMLQSIVPYDSLDAEVDFLQADTYWSSIAKLSPIAKTSTYDIRLLNKVLRRHHRNAIFAIVVTIIIITIIGYNSQHSFFIIPAAASFVLLFSLVLMLVGIFKYLTRSWEFLGWLGVLAVISLLVYCKVINMSTEANGLDYSVAPFEYNYATLQEVSNATNYRQDIDAELKRLDEWKAKYYPDSKPNVVIITASGGGSRSAYWTLEALQYADSITKGSLYKNTLLISGASGGMIGATYWQAIRTKNNEHYLPEFQENIGKDLLNPIVFHMASVDFIAARNRINFQHHIVKNNAANAFEQTLLQNTNGYLAGNLGNWRTSILAHQSPLFVINGTIANDGRKLMMSPLGITYLTRQHDSWQDNHPVIDAVDFRAIMRHHKADSLFITSALRMNATFPVILPLTELPTQPKIEIIDAGLRDNFGAEVALRYIFCVQDWLKANANKVIFLQIRDTKPFEPSEFESHPSFAGQVLAPLTTLQNKWSSIQTYGQQYAIQLLEKALLPNQLVYETLYYDIRKSTDKKVSLNFHLTASDKRNLSNAIDISANQATFHYLQTLFP